ncbi:MAG: HU family DNA-binding protein [Desulfovibrio sp.]|nr:HU family DNA-binding protein [Desulfovibrio sp.]
MTKAELIEKISSKVENLTKAQVEELLNIIVETLREALVAGETIALTGFGNFKVVKRAERKGHNPQTQEKIIIPARNVTKFTPCKALKEAINPKKS